MVTSTCETRSGTHLNRPAGSHRVGTRGGSNEPRLPIIEYAPNHGHYTVPLGDTPPASQSRRGPVTRACHTVGCTFVKILGPRGSDILQGITADSIKTLLYRGLMVAITVTIAFVVTGNTGDAHPDRLRNEPREDRDVRRLRATVGTCLLRRRGGLIEPVARGFGVRQSRLFPRIEGGEIRHRITADPVAMHGSPSARTGSPRFSGSENPLVV